MTTNVDRATTRVFVTNFQEMDFAPAEKFGECVFITRGFVPLTDIGKLRDKLKAHVAYSKSEDYVILTGPAVLIATFQMLWTAKHGFINILSYNKKEKEYVPYTIGLDGNDS